MRILRIYPIQLAMPEGQEEWAREFYCGLLGLPEVQKPAVLVPRGGVWFEDGEVRVHLGVDADFRPARKAHPAFVVQELEMLARRLREADVEVIEDDFLPGYDRVYVADPFGNRLELMEPKR
jgi:catechol 2,3-dioxygenase-like lactoylglutathione lyase family enzyme